MDAQGALRRMTAMVLLSLAVQISASWQVSAQTNGSRDQSFLLGTGATEGTYHPVGIALSTLVKLKLLPSLDIDLTAINTGGSYDNIDLVRQGDVEFAILSALSAHEVQQGIGRFADLGPDENLRAITTLWRSADHLIVGKDAVQSGTINDFIQMRGQKMSLGQRGSTALETNRSLLEPLGIDVEADFDLVEFGYDESVDALISGEIAGMAVSGSFPINAVQRLFDAHGDEVAFLELSDEQLAYIDQGRRVWTRDVIPAETYSGQERDIYTVSTPNILAVRADVSDDVVYQVTKMIFENLDYLHGLHEATTQISLDTAVDNVPLPIHEGALRYFEEKGVELPPPPVEINPNLLSRFDDTNQARQETNRGVLSIFAGAEGETSTRIAAELASTLNLADDGFRLLPTFGGGSGQNLIDLLYLKDVDSALLRTDVIAYATDNEVYPSLDDQIAYITEMFPEEVHLIVRDDVSNVRELEGKKVNVGLPGSGGDITASIILSQLDIAVQPTTFGPYLALDKLERGEISGAFFIGGKPVPLLKQIDRDSGLKLMSLPFVQYRDSYRSTEITPADYPNLLGKDQGEAISTIAVRTGLFTYDWRTDSPRYQTLAQFSDVFFDHLSEFHQDGRHPKWKQVDPTSEIDGLTRFDPARTWVESNFDQAQRIALEGRYLIDQAAASSAPAAPAQAAAPNPTDTGPVEASEPVTAPFLLDNGQGAAGLPGSPSIEVDGDEALDAAASPTGNAPSEQADDAVSTLPAADDAAEDNLFIEPGEAFIIDEPSSPPSSGGPVETWPPAATANSPTF